MLDGKDRLIIFMFIIIMPHCVRPYKIIFNHDLRYYTITVLSHRTIAFKTKITFRNFNIIINRSYFFIFSTFV